MKRTEALALLQKYNQDPFHILHALTVEGTMNGMLMNSDMRMKSIIGVL